MKIDKRMRIALLVSGLSFILFAGLSVYQAAQMRAARAEAQYYFDQLAQSEEACTSNNLGDETCSNRTRWRQQFDRQIVEIDQHRSLAVLFLTFAIFISAITWACYYLTRAIFPDQSPSQ